MDATRRGNLAHLLNHSCAPNCSSRTLTLWDEARGRQVDHVVIFAAKHIPVRHACAILGMQMGLGHTEC